MVTKEQLREKLFDLAKNDSMTAENVFQHSDRRT